MNKWIDQHAFKNEIKDHQSILVGGFMGCGTPERFIDWILETEVKNLTIICNDAGFPDRGVGRLIASQRVKKLIASHIGLNPEAGRLMSEGQLEVELVPQGTLAERIRSYGAGLGGVLTPTGIHTIVEKDKQVIKINKKPYILEEALGADIALIEAHQGDVLGNLTYDKTARNFNPIIATAAGKVFALVDRKVSSIDPEVVITPHVFVDYLVEVEVR